MTSDSPLKPRHQTFALLYVLGKNATQAYLEAFPDTTPDSAKASACKLLTQDNVKQEISRLQQEKHEEIKEREGIVSTVNQDYWNAEKVAELRKQLYESTEDDKVKVAILKDVAQQLPDAPVDGKLVISWGD